ncbi:MAG: Yip1 family protein [Paracoccaceae bacterium]
MTLKDYVQAAIFTARNPRKGAQWVMSSTMTRAQRWETLVLVLVSSIILVEITLLISGAGNQVFLGGAALLNPLISGSVQLGFLVAMVCGVYFIGRRMGGTGSLDNAILLIAWSEFVMACLQVVQMIAILLMPFVAALIGLASVVLFFWLLTNFVTELHGFKSRGNVFFVILASIFGFVIFLLLALSVIGFQFSG